MLRRIQDAGLTLNHFKCEFKQRSVEYLVKQAQLIDEVLCQVKKHVQSGWHLYLSSTDTMLKPYFEN